MPRYPVWFNAADFERYSSLRLKTPFHVKVKQIVYDYLEKKGK